MEHWNNSKTFNKISIRKISFDTDFTSIGPKCTYKPKSEGFYPYSALQEASRPTPSNAVHAVGDENFLRTLFFKRSRFWVA